MEEGTSGVGEFGEKGDGREPDALARCSFFSYAAALDLTRLGGRATRDCVAFSNIAAVSFKLRGCVYSSLCSLIVSTVGYVSVNRNL